MPSYEDDGFEAGTPGPPAPGDPWDFPKSPLGTKVTGDAIYRTTFDTPCVWAEDEDRGEYCSAHDHLIAWLEPADTPAEAPPGRGCD